MIKYARRYRGDSAWEKPLCNSPALVFTNWAASRSSAYIPGDKLREEFIKRYEIVKLELKEVEVVDLPQRI